MATSGTVRGRLSQTAILDLLSGWTAGKPLPVLHFCSPSDHLDQLWTSIAFLIRSREHGFMVILPHVEAIETVLQEWVDGEGYPVAIYEAADVVIETMRGRTLGTASVLLVDMPWLGAAQFRRPIALRRDATDSILRITVEDQIGRPRSNEAWAASEAWLLSKEPDDVLQEYYSADSGGGGEEFPEQIPGADHAPVGEDQSDVIGQMQARIQQLEAEAAGRTSLLAAPAPAQELFPMQMAAGGLRQEDWDQLQKLAGPAPKRAPRPEAATAYRGEEFDTQAEVRLEAQEEDALAQLAQTGDPLHRILAMRRPCWLGWAPGQATL